MSANRVSLRDKNRERTSLEIHRAAERLALEHGVQEARVEDIAAAAGVSRRTFFNYFVTKEDAIIGLRPPVLTEEALGQFRDSDENMLARTVRLLVRVSRSTSVYGNSIKEQVELRKRFPVLWERFASYSQDVEQLVKPIIADHLAGDEADAEVLIRLSGAILRYAYTLDHEMKSSSVEEAIQKFINVMGRMG